MKAYCKVTIPMITRMRELADAGLGCQAIAVVIGVDYGTQPSRYTVAKYVGRTAKGRKAGAEVRKVHAGSFAGAAL